MSDQRNEVLQVEDVDIRLIKSFGDPSFLINGSGKPISDEAYEQIRQVIVNESKPYIDEAIDQLPDRHVSTDDADNLTSIKHIDDVHYVTSDTSLGVTGLAIVSEYGKVDALRYSDKGWQHAGEGDDVDGALNLAHGLDS